MKSIKVKKTYHIMAPAIEELRQALNVVTTNEPINRKRGDVGQAELEHGNAKSFRKAIGVLRKHA